MLPECFGIWYNYNVASRQAVASHVTWEDCPPETYVIREVMEDDQSSIRARSGAPEDLERDSRPC